MANKKIRIINIFTFLLALLMFIGISNAVTPPSGVLYYLPITLTDSNSVAVGTTVAIQIGNTNTNGLATNAIGINSMIGFPATSYSQYETPTLNNAEFFYANGVIVNSWMEGNLINENTANDLANSPTSVNALISSANVVYWVTGIYIPGNTAGTAGTNTIYLGWAGNIISASNTLLTGVITGEAPQLSCSNPYSTATCNGIYAQYDNGANVFNFYDNFIGQTLAATYNSFNAGTAPSETTSNGLTVTCNSCAGTGGGYFSNTIQYYISNTVDSYAEQTSVGSYIGPLFASPNGISQSYWIEGNNAHLFSVDQLAGVGTSATNKYYVLTLASPYSGNANFQEGYTNYQAIQTQNRLQGYVTSNYIGVSVNFYNGGSGTGGGFYQWLRGRQQPPGSIMPATTYGSVTQTPANNAIIITSISNSIVDQGQWQSVTASNNLLTGTNTWTFQVVNSFKTNKVVNVITTSVSTTTATVTYFIGANDPANSPIDVNVLVTGIGNSIYYSYTAYNALGIPSISTTTAIPSNQIAGNVITFNAYVTGGAPTLQYNFIVYNSVTNAQIASSGYTSTNSYAFSVLNSYAGNTIYANVFVEDGATTTETTNSILTAKSITLLAGGSTGTTTFTETGLPQGSTWNAIYDAMTNVSAPFLNWQTANAYVNPTEDKGNCVYNGGYITCVGGFNDNEGEPYVGNEVNTVAYAQVFTNGNIGAWQTTNAVGSNFGNGIHAQAVATAGNYIYVVGGLHTVPSTGIDNYAIPDVWYAKLLPGGGVSAWIQGNNLPNNAAEEGIAVVGNYLYVIGGAAAWVPATFTANVYSAQINLNTGGLATWTKTTSYPFAPIEATCQPYLGYIYCIGGTNEANVYYATASGGTVGTWHSAQNYPNTISLGGSAISNGKIYYVGGYTTTGGTQVENAVNYGTVTSTNTIVSWNGVQNYPILNNAAACASYNGYLTCIGGVLFNTPSGAEINSVNSVYYSAINTNTITFNPVAGVYSYTIANQIINGTTYIPTPSSGTLGSAGTQSISFSPSAITTISAPYNAIVDVGQYETFTATVGTGFSAPYQYTFNSVNSITLKTTNTFTITGQSLNAYTWTYYINSFDTSNSPEQANVFIVDSGSHFSSSAYSSTYTVNPALATPTLAISNTLIDAGEYTLVTPSYSGGTPNYVQNIIISNSVTLLPINSIQVTVSSPTAELFYLPSWVVGNSLEVNVVVTDSASVPFTKSSSYTPLGFNSILGHPSILPFNPSIGVGGSVSFTSTWTGGTTDYSATLYSSSTSTCNTGSSLVQTLSSLTSGSASFSSVSPVVNTYYCIFVTDSATTQQITNSITSEVTVGGALSTSLGNPTNSIVDQGQWQSVTASISGGVQPYTLTYYVVNAITNSIIANVITASTAGSTHKMTYFIGANDPANSPLEVNVVVADSGTNVVTSGYVSYNAFTAFSSLIISPSSTETIDLGQSILFTSSTTGGASPFIYQWLSGSSSCSSNIVGATSSTYTANPGSTGNYYYCAKATDSATTNEILTSLATELIVNPTLIAGAITPTSPSVTPGGSVTLTANPSGGTPPYIYQWFTGSSCNTAIAGATSFTYLASPIVATTYSYKVTDEAVIPGGVCSPGDTVTINTGVLPAVAIYFQNATDPINLQTFTPPPCSNNLPGGLCQGNVIYSTTCTLTQDLFVDGNIMINSGQTLTTNGFIIVTNGNFYNLGTIYAGLLNNGGANVMSGGNALNIITSYGGSGGAGGGYFANIGGNGGNTLVSGAIGTTSNGGNGALPSSPIISNANIITWYHQGSGTIYKYLGGAGGGGGANSGGAGGGGSNGCYIQANQLTEGTVNTVGGSGTSPGGGFGASGGGGGGICILAYNAIFAAGSTSTTGGAGGAGSSTSGGNGGSGNVILYRYMTAPIPAVTFYNYYPIKIYSNTLEAITFTGNQLYNNVKTNLFTSLSNINYTPPSNQVAGFYQYNFTEYLGDTTTNSFLLNVTINMTDIISALTFNTPIIQYFPNFAYTPSFSVSPVSWCINSDNPKNQETNTLTGCQWSNANLSFSPSLTLTYANFTPFTTNLLNNPALASITQNAFIFVAQNTIPTNIISRKVLNATSFNLQYFNTTASGRNDSFTALFNNYTLSTTAIAYSTNTFPNNNTQIYIPISNYQNPPITFKNYTSITISSGYVGQTQEDYCPFTLANGNHANIFSYLPNGAASGYSMTVLLSNGNPANGYFLQVQSQSPQVTVLSYFMQVASGFLVYLEPHTNYRFVLYNSNCQFVYATQYSQWSNPISISIPVNTSVSPVIPPNHFFTNISSQCYTTPIAPTNTLLTCVWHSLNNTAFATTLNVSTTGGVISNQTCYVNAYGTANTLTCILPYTNRIQYSYLFNLIDSPQPLSAGLVGTFVSAYGANGTWFWILMVATLILLGVTRSPTLTILFFEAGITAGGLLGFVPYTGYILGSSYIAAALILYMINRGNG